MNRPHWILSAAQRELHNKIVTRKVSIAIPLECVNNLLPSQLVSGSKRLQKIQKTEFNLETGLLIEAASCPD